jgi:hypothetical protein
MCSLGIGVNELLDFLSLCRVVGIAEEGAE